MCQIPYRLEPVSPKQFLPFSIPLCPVQTHLRLPNQQPLPELIRRRVSIVELISHFQVWKCFNLKCCRHSFWFICFSSSVNGDASVRPQAARRENRRSISPTRSSNVQQQPSEYSTENERSSITLGGNKRPRLEAMRPSGFAPLRVIAERDGEHSASSLHIQDIENGDDGGHVFSLETRNDSRPSRPGASKETGV